MELIYQRDIYGKTLIELGRKNKDIVVLDADLSGSTRTSLFAKEFPDRFFNFGVAEQNMMASAAGLAISGKIVFASTFAMFATGRAWDQIRNTICYNKCNVKIVASHAGLTVGEDGASHQALEDIAIMRVIPNMNIIVPCDGPRMRDAVIAAVDNAGPFYIRMGRSKSPAIEGKKSFKFGKAEVLREGDDVAIIACGIMVSAALEAADILAKEAIKAMVLNFHTIKPFDQKTLVDVAGEIKRLVVCEEHSITGGLGCCVDEALALNCSARIARVGIKNQFGQSGRPAQLLEQYGLTSGDIVVAAKSLL